MRHTASHSGAATRRSDAAVGDDLDAPIGDEDVNQHAVVVLGVPDAQLREHLERTGAGAGLSDDATRRQRRFDGESYLARVSVARRAPMASSMASRVLAGKSIRVRQCRAAAWRIRRRILITSSPRRRRRRNHRRPR